MLLMGTRGQSHRWAEKGEHQTENLSIPGTTTAAASTFDCLDHSTYIAFSLSVEGRLSSGNYIFFYILSMHVTFWVHHTREKQAQVREKQTEAAIILQTFHMFFSSATLLRIRSHCNFF